MFLSLSTRWILLKTGIGLKIGKHKPIIKLFQGLTPDVTGSDPRCYIQTPLIGMRIWLGLIFKIMVRMKSYILPELCYLTKSIGKCAKL